MISSLAKLKKCPTTSCHGRFCPQLLWWSFFLWKWGKMTSCKDVSNAEPLLSRIFLFVSIRFNEWWSLLDFLMLCYKVIISGGSCCIKETFFPAKLLRSRDIKWKCLKIHPSWYASTDIHKTYFNVKFIHLYIHFPILFIVYCLYSYIYSYFVVYSSPYTNVHLRMVS